MIILNRHWNAKFLNAYYHNMINVLFYTNFCLRSHMWLSIIKLTHFLLRKRIAIIKCTKCTSAWWRTTANQAKNCHPNELFKELVPFYHECNHEFSSWAKISSVVLRSFPRCLPIFQSVRRKIRVIYSYVVYLQCQEHPQNGELSFPLWCR